MILSLLLSMYSSVTDEFCSSSSLLRAYWPISVPIFYYLTPLSSHPFMILAALLIEYYLFFSFTLKLSSFNYYFLYICNVRYYAIIFHMIFVFNQTSGIIACPPRHHSSFRKVFAVPSNRFMKRWDAVLYSDFRNIELCSMVQTPNARMITIMA